MSTERAKINANAAPAATNATKRSVLLAGGFLLHRIEAGEHERKFSR